MTEDRYLELAPLAALGVLDGEDHSGFQAHVPGCMVCKAELSAHESVAALIPLTLVPVQPSRAVRERLVSGGKAANRERRDFAQLPGRPGCGGGGRIAPARGMESCRTRPDIVPLRPSTACTRSKRAVSASPGGTGAESGVRVASATVKS